MAPKKSKQSRPSPSTPPTNISDLIRDCDIPNSVKIRSISEEVEKKWRTEGLSENLLVLGKRHIETIHCPIHPLILQFTAAHRILLMQLTLNSIKCIVASIILNEVEDKRITLTDLLFALRINKTPTPPNALSRAYNIFYLFTNNPHQRSSLCSPVSRWWTKTERLRVVFLSSMANGFHLALIVKPSPSPPNLLGVSIAATIFIIVADALCHYYFLLKISLILATSTVTSNFLPPERLDALIREGVFHQEWANAQDINNICSAKAMKCLIGYALHPSFLDPAFFTSISLTKEELLKLKHGLSRDFLVVQ